MVYPWTLRALAIGTLAISTLALAMGTLSSFDFGDESILAAIVIATLLGIGIWMFFEIMGRAFLITSNEVIRVTRGGRRQRIRFSEVSSIKWGYTIRSIDGRRIVVSSLLLGQREFARIILEKVRASRLKCEGHLKEAAGSRVDE